MLNGVSSSHEAILHIVTLHIQRHRSVGAGAHRGDASSGNSRNARSSLLRDRNTSVAL